MKAVNSIPAYVERSTHFLAIVPTVQHLDLHGTVCDLGTWLGRGWCRVEIFSLLLARYNTNPAIVVKGGASSPYMISPTVVASRAPGFGMFTCCARNHVMVDSNGVEKAIPCEWHTRGGYI